MLPGRNQIRIAERLEGISDMNGTALIFLYKINFERVASGHWG
jgi:hypothetical protein